MRVRDLVAALSALPPDDVVVVEVDVVEVDWLYEDGVKRRRPVTKTVVGARRRSDSDFSVQPNPAVVIVIGGPL